MSKSYNVYFKMLMLIVSIMLISEMQVLDLIKELLKKFMDM